MGKWKTMWFDVLLAEVCHHSGLCFHGGQDAKAAGHYPPQRASHAEERGSSKKRYKLLPCEKRVHTKPTPRSHSNQHGGCPQQHCCQTFGRPGMRIPSLWLAFSFALVFSGNLADSPVGKVVELGRRAIGLRHSYRSQVVFVEDVVLPACLSSFLCRPWIVSTSDNIKHLVGTPPTPQVRFLERNGPPLIIISIAAIITSSPSSLSSPCRHSRHCRHVHRLGGSIISSVWFLVFLLVLFCIG